jgi:uncharacterized protein
VSQLPKELAAKCDRLLELLQGYGSCAVAFSGGLDSSVLAQAAQLALGDRAVAVTGISATLAAGELEDAKRVAQQIGIRHEMIETGELCIPEYRQNTAERCYYCKSELFGRLEGLARRMDLAVIVDGGQGDDCGQYRPGARAARERNVRSPLAECSLTKAELRTLASYWGLSVWDKPATPCLSSRIAYGQEVTPKRLAMVDRAEQFLRGLGFQPLRVRYHQGDVARIEVAAESLARFADAELRRDVVEHFRSIGFKFVSLDLEGFRSGSLNTILPHSKPQRSRG